MLTRSPLAIHHKWLDLALTNLLYISSLSKKRERLDFITNILGAHHLAEEACLDAIWSGASTPMTIQLVVPYHEVIYDACNGTQSQFGLQDLSDTHIRLLIMLNREQAYFEESEVWPQATKQCKSTEILLGHIAQYRQDFRRILGELDQTSLRKADALLRDLV